MSSDPALDTLKWERETTKILLDTLQTHGPPNQATRALVNHRPFANGRALNLYHFEHKNNIWVAQDKLPATFYIYATATPTKKIITNTFMRNILNTISIPTYANTLNPQCIVAIGLFTAITPRRQKELNQLVPCPLIHMDGKNPQILEMTSIWPLPHPYKINPEMDSKNKHRLRVQQYFPLTEPQHKALWQHCQNEFSLVLRTHTKNKRKEPTTTKHQTTNTHAEMNPPAAVAPNSVEKTKRKAPQQAPEAEGSTPMDTSSTEGTTSLVPYPTEEAKQKEKKAKQDKQQHKQTKMEQLKQTNPTQYAKKVADQAAAAQAKAARKQEQAAQDKKQKEAWALQAKAKEQEEQKANDQRIETQKALENIESLS